MIKVNSLRYTGTVLGCPMVSCGNQTHPGVSVCSGISTKPIRILTFWPFTVNYSDSDLFRQRFKSPSFLFWTIQSDLMLLSILFLFQSLSCAPLKTVKCIVELSSQSVLIFQGQLWAVKVLLIPAWDC